jgi:hypothetical protein
LLPSCQRNILIFSGILAHHKLSAAFALIPLCVRKEYRDLVEKHLNMSIAHSTSSSPSDGLKGWIKSSKALKQPSSAEGDVPSFRVPAVRHPHLGESAHFEYFGELNFQGDLSTPHILPEGGFLAIFHPV